MAEKGLELDYTATILNTTFVIPARYFTKLNNVHFYWMWGWLTPSIHQRY